MNARTKYGLFLAAFFLVAALAYAAPPPKISAKQLQGIWEVTEQGDYNEETKKIEALPEIMTSRYLFFQNNETCSSVFLPTNRCEGSAFQPFTIQGNILIREETERTPGNQTEITLRGKEMTLLDLPYKTSHIKARKLKSAKQTKSSKQTKLPKQTKKIPLSEGAPSPGELFFITQPDLLGRWKLEGGGGKGRSYFEFRESDACVMASIDAVSGKPDPCDPSQYFPYYTEANKVYITEGPSFSLSYTFTKKSKNVLEFIFPDEATKGKLVRMK